MDDIITVSVKKHNKKNKPPIFEVVEINGGSVPSVKEGQSLTQRDFQTINAMSGVQLIIGET
jgi:hypothetical protein